MDPGNWATDIAGGARFGYTLLSVVKLSNLLAILLQSLSLKLGVATDRDLAQICRENYGPRLSFALWIGAEIAIAACDLAEVIGSAIALQLLFGLPLLWGVVLTAADTFALLFLSQLGIRKLEALILSFITVIAGAFVLQVFLAKPVWADVGAGLVPRLPGSPALFVALGMLGATVMPHNLYLHSSIVQTRKYGDSSESRGEAVSFAILDSTVALTSALFINAAILVVAAATFHGTPYEHIADISDAYKMLSPMLGTTLASTMFAVALLFSGQNSTLTGTLAGQIVMEGFLDLRMRPWLRRVITRAVAIVPAVVTIAVFGERASGSLLILSQVVLSLQLPFAVIPLVLFVSDRQRMGRFAIGPVMKGLAWLCASVILALNAWLLVESVRGWF
jgi:manganese transport protein